MANSELSGAALSGAARGSYRVGTMSAPIPTRKPDHGLRARMHELIFEADTRSGKFFDLALIFCILPTYLSLLFPAGRYLLVIRMLRVLRIFRILKLVQLLDEARHMNRVLRASVRRLAVFFATVIVLVVVFGSVMYVVEGEQNGFTSIPRRVYWAIVTMTTVGYGDISPRTALGQSLASLVMLVGFSIIAVPTGIVAAEFRRARGGRVSTQVCPQCAAEGHDVDAVYCRICGSRL